MTSANETIQAAGFDFDRVEAPEGIGCWTVQIGASDEEGTVNILTDDGAMPAAATIEVAGNVAANFDVLVEVATIFLREHLRAPDYAILPEEQELIASGPAQFAHPEAVVWADGTWMMRFADSPLAIADPFGVGVLFVGSAPQSIEDFSEVDDEDDEDDE